MPYCAGEGVSRIFLCNDGAIRTDREGVYTDIVESLRQRLAKFEETRHSDIVRTVVLAAKEDAVEGRPLSLYIYSDLIENSDYLPGRKFFSTSVDRLIIQLRKDKLIAPLNNPNVQPPGALPRCTKNPLPSA